MRRLTFFILLLIGVDGFTQGIKYLPTNINHRAKNNIYPAISGDGKTMLFLSDYTNNEELGLMITKYVGGKWQDPKEVEGIGPESVNNIGGYSITNDGGTIWFSSRRPNGVGGYDIWYMRKSGDGWTRPVNPAIPLNSAQHEGNPSVSPDGERIYFMVCSSITRATSKGCKLYFSEKNHMPGQRPWKAPQQLPAKLNMGNTVSPRILSDNRTLLFASDRPGGQGGLDIWQSRRDGEDWSDPVNVSFANTAEDDEFMAISLRNDISYFTKNDDKGFGAIVQSGVPEEFRPDNVIMLIGNTLDQSGNPLSLEIRVNDYNQGKLIDRVTSSTKDGSYIAVLPAGRVYEVSYSERTSEKEFYTEVIDATELRGSRRVYPKTTLRDVGGTMILPVNGIQFEPGKDKLSTASNYEVLRLVRLLKKNTEMKAEIDVYQQSYMEDSLPSNPDLTELRVDTIITYELPIPVDSLNNPQKDSLVAEINDTLMHSITDTTIVDTMLARMAGIDSVEVVSYKYTYHNDRTQAQAAAIVKVLVEKGIPQDRLTAVGRKDEDPPQELAAGQDRQVYVKLTEE